VSDVEYVVTFVVMLAVGLVISTLTVRLRQQATDASSREQRITALYTMSREFASTRGMKKLLHAAVQNINQTFDSQVVILLPNAAGGLQPWGEVAGWWGEGVNERTVFAPDAHDLRTPLAVITGATSSLVEGATTLEPATRVELAQTAYDEAEWLNRLIGNLLDMTRLESGAVQVQKEWQPLEEVVGAALTRLDDRLHDHPVTASLPPDGQSAPLDSVLIEQVLINLLENAIKYTSPGSPIEISAAGARDAVTVTIADRGPDIPPGDEQRVFDKFYRARSGDGSGGVGLGLTICRRIAEAHGGRIWLENRPGGGAAFHFTLPLEGTPPPVAPEMEAPTDHAATTTSS
jgi:K+-sensing histidine kinase KdpD